MHRFLRSNGRGVGVSCVGKYLVAILPCIQGWGEGNQQAQISEAKTRLESKNFGRAASFAEAVLLSNSPIHFNTSSTSAEDKAHHGSYSNSFPISFSFFSISLNHSLSMHSTHFLPNLEFDKSRIVEISGALITTLHHGTYTSFLCSIGRFDKRSRWQRIC